MIRSMTAYARQEIKQDWGTAAWELRSVNQRYLEVFTRLPEQFRSLEPIIRERIRQRLTRGKIECYLRFEPNPDQQNGVILNESLALHLIQAANWVKLQSDEGQIDPLQLLRWPGVISAAEQDLDAISEQMIAALDKVLDELIQNREREGQSLKALLEQRLQGIHNQVQTVRTQMPQILDWQREKLQSKLAEAQIQLDSNRIEQELILLAQRIDVAEELDRLEAHVKETRLTLDKPEAVGRRLDFMMHEFNREANTLASKSINADVTASAIELKVLIEQMREQIQNIE